MKKIVLFPGWGYPADFYNFLKDIFEDVEIVSGYKKIEQKIESDVVIGWSMGAINLLKNYENINSKKIILISPTFNFVNSIKVKYIKAMIKKIKVNKEELLKDFYNINFYDKSKYSKFIEEYLDKGKIIEDEELENGLNFLMNTVVDEDIKIKSKVIVLCGEKDSVIPYKNSKEVADKLNAELVIFEETGHNIISERTKELIEIVRR